MLWLIFPRLDKPNLGVFRQPLSWLRMCVALSEGSSAANQFPQQTSILRHIKHVCHDRPARLFIEAIRRLSYNECYSRPFPGCVWRVHGAGFMTHREVGPHTVAVRGTSWRSCHTSLVCPRAHVLRCITPVWHGDCCVCLPTKTEKWKQLSLHLDLQSVWSHLLCHNITSPSLQYLGVQPGPLFMLYSGIEIDPPPPTPHTHKKEISPSCYNLLWKMNICDSCPASKESTCCRSCFVSRQRELL